MYFYTFKKSNRNATEEEKGISLGGEEKIIEYDGWINPEDKSSSGYSWDGCSSSIFIPCKTNDVDVSGFIEPRVKEEPSSDRKKLQKSSKFSTPIETEDGFDVDEDVDFYLDFIEDDKQKGSTYCTFDTQ